MKKIILILIVAGMAFARQIPHPLTVGATSRVISQNDTVRILAIMVQFQTDSDNRTSGNGQFDLGVAAVPIIDAPPHDSAYFADHFIFARNYFRKASNGKQKIDATVLGKVITLPKQMKEYAPISGNLPLAEMIRDSWRIADSLNPGFSFSSYDLFMVFHAGVGKDIDLRGALGYDPTPFDLPSLYFNFNGLKNIFGPSFAGFPVQSSLFHIKNTIVLPETEVRKIPSIGEDITLKLSINGLLVASIASHFGLPDLFDTKTGKTAIGRFGLMDGQSIFSYSGICPPEPSAWEKYYLGWTTVIDVYGSRPLEIPAVSLYESGMDTVYRIPISSKEYFLVENRQRDAKQNGQQITMKWNGQIITKTFNRDEIYFSNTNIDSVYGVVLDVDELDWSIPGLINSNNDYRGGILVWHIDESIIEKNLATNSVNANPILKGVDVEEADGSQDIGQSYDLLSPGSGSEDGSPLDYWFKGNIAPVYKNEFSTKSSPNTLSNAFARTHITLKKFSSSSPRMSFEAHIGSTNIQLAKVIRGLYPKQNNDDAPFAADLNGDGKEEIIYTSGDSIFVLKDDLTPYLNNTTGLFFPKGGSYQPAFYLSTISGNPFPRGLVCASDSTIYFINPIDGNNDGTADLFRMIHVGDRISTPVTVRDVLPVGNFIVGTQSGKYIVADSVASVHNTFSSPVISVNSAAFVSRDSIHIQGIKRKNSSPIISLASINTNLIVVNDESVTVYDLNSNEIVRQFQLPGKVTASIAIQDLNGDNNGDIIIGIGNNLYAYNLNGSVLENFPIRLSKEEEIRGGIIIIDTKILFGTKNGLLYAVTKKGEVVDGFPLQNEGMMSAPFVGAKYIISSSVDSSISIWQHNNLFANNNNDWKTYLGSLSHNSNVTIAGAPILKSLDILPKKFAYNWPNPVYAGSTNIRYFLGKEANVHIKIINMAGELVDELRGTNYVGFDNEVQWNVSNIESGIYYAHITAIGSEGEQSQIIKIAVVK